MNQPVAFHVADDDQSFHLLVAAKTGIRRIFFMEVLSATTSWTKKGAITS